MDNQKLGAVLLEIQDLLSEDDRVDLHFYLRSHIPPRIRDDLSLNGTLSLIESLFDQGQINEGDLTLLINALESIRCYHAANLLKDYQSRENHSLPNQLEMDQCFNTFEIEYDQPCEHIPDVKLTTTGSNSLTKFQFIVVDLSTRLDPVSLAMLQSLNTMIGESMLIVKANSAIDLARLPNKPTFLFTSSSFAATMKEKPNSIEARFILEDDQNKIDHHERFGSGRDLLFQLTDEVSRCYQKEVIECFQSGDGGTAKIKEAFANRIYTELKRVYNEASGEKNNAKTLMNTRVTIVWLELKMNGRNDMERMRRLLSTFISSFVAFENQMICEHYLLHNESAGLVYLIINTDQQVFVEARLQQLPQLKMIYHDEQTSSNGSYNDLCFRLLFDLAAHYNRIGCTYSSKHGSQIAKEMFFKAHQLYNLLAHV